LCPSPPLSKAGKAAGATERTGIKTGTGHHERKDS
jgi:hypothetical protein